MDIEWFVSIQNITEILLRKRSKGKMLRHHFEEV